MATQVVNLSSKSLFKIHNRWWIHNFSFSILNVCACYTCKTVEQYILVHLKLHYQCKTLVESFICVKPYEQISTFCAPTIQWWFMSSANHFSFPQTIYRRQNLSSGERHKINFTKVIITYLKIFCIIPYSSLAKVT